MQQGKRTHSPLASRTSSSKHTPSSPSSKKLRSAGQIAGYASNPSSSNTSVSTIAPSSHSSSTTTMLGETRFPTTRPQPTQTTPFPLPHHHHHHPHYVKTTNMDDNDRSSVSDNDSLHSPPPSGQQLGVAPGVVPGSVTSAGGLMDGLHRKVSVGADEKPKPAPGKKTRGRVKIEMQYIQNKLRRYTTFSKRKSGIMKKVSFTEEQLLF